MLAKMKVKGSGTLHTETEVRIIGFRKTPLGGRQVVVRIGEEDICLSEGNTLVVHGAINLSCLAYDDDD